MKGAYSQWQKFNKSLEIYFNPIGRLYIKYVAIARFLFFSTFLGDIGGGGDKLACDTKQIGCTVVCNNRYTPVNHHKIWAFEMFTVALINSIFYFLNYLNRKSFESYKKKLEAQSGAQNAEQNALLQPLKFTSARKRKNVQVYTNSEGNKKFSVETHRGKDIIRSNYVAVGYFLMLALRLIAEFFFILLEISLAKHQSQKAGLWESFQLNEYWHCITNSNEMHGFESQELHDVIVPVNNRTMFYREDLTVACGQQVGSVKCWIPFSRLKTLGMQFMFYVLIVQICLTVLELLVEIKRSLSKSRNQAAQVEIERQERMRQLA